MNLRQARACSKTVFLKKKGEQVTQYPDSGSQLMAPNREEHKLQAKPVLSVTEKTEGQPSSLAVTSLLCQPSSKT